MAEPKSRGRRPARSTVLTRRGRESVAQGTPGTGAPALQVLAHVRELLAENQALKNELSRLGLVMARIAAMAGASEVMKQPPARRRRRTRAEIDAAKAELPRTKVKQVRRKVTDPIALEKRRDALAKARAVRADRLRSGG